MPEIKLTDNKEEKMKNKEKNYCPVCNKYHHIFIFAPSWKAKQATCGQWFTPEGKAV